MVLAVGFLLLVSLMVSAVLAALGKFFGGFLPVPEFVLSGINFVVSLAGIAVLFALIFRYVPETKTAWKVVGIGAIVTAVLFTVGKSLIGCAAGSLVVVIVWVYYSAMIFLFGAAFTHMLDCKSPRQNAQTR
jgi:membrane protein